MKKFIYWLVITIGTVLIISGLVALVIFAITFDKTPATAYGFAGGAVAILLGLTVVRLVEKSWEKYGGYILDVITYGW